MKIGFLVNDISNVGGVERVVAILSNYFMKEFNYDVKIISIYKPKRKENGFYFNENIDIVYLNQEERWKGFFHDLRYHYKIYKEFLLDVDVDVMFTMYTTINVCVALLKNKLKYKTISCQHGQFYYDSFKWNLIKKITYRNLQSLVLLTKRDAETYSKFINNVRIIPNPSPFQAECLYDSDSKKILSIGRLSEEKSIAYLIDAFKLISDKHKDWTLEIVGDGPEKEMLISKASEYGLGSKITFSPFTLDVKEKYKEAAFTVLTSQSEALPMMLIESKSLGIPSVSFDILTGPEEIINHGIDGYLVEKNNIKELAYKMDLMISDDNKRKEMSKKALVNSAKFDEKTVCNKWFELINEII